MRYGVCLFLLAIILGSCAKPPITAATSTNDWLETLTTGEVGKGSTIEANQNNSFTLCWNEAANPSNNMPVLKFIIVRMSDHKVVEQGSVTMGSIKWTDDYQVEVSHAPGQVELERGVNKTTRTIELSKYLDVIGR
jgi:hypothetical protein